MKKNASIICLLFILLFIPSKINAYYCSDSDISNEKKMAANITYNYIYVEKNNSVTFNIIFTNIKNGFYLKETTTKKVYTGNSEVTLSGFKSDKEYRFEVYSLSGCVSESLRVIYVKTPGYNKYYKDSLCQGIEEYKYCQKWKNVNLSYEEFKEDISEYKKSLNIEEKEKKENISVLNKIGKVIGEIYSKYYYLILLPVIVISIMLIIKKDNDSKLR